MRLIPSLGVFRRRRRSTCCLWTTWNWETWRKDSCPASTSSPSSTLSRGVSSHNLRAAASDGGRACANSILRFGGYCHQERVQRPASDWAGMRHAGGCGQLEGLVPESWCLPRERPGPANLWIYILAFLFLSKRWESPTNPHLGTFWAREVMSIKPCFYFESI